MWTKVAILAVIAVVAVKGFIPIKKEIYVPMPYSFGYNIKDKHGEQYREETGDGKELVKGSYGFVDEKGIKRQVNYVADKLGFRAEVKTNEPGTANQDPAAVKMISSAFDGAGGLGLGVGAGGIGFGLGAEGIGLGGIGLGAGLPLGGGLFF